MTSGVSPRRHGFTLLEVMLALAVGVILLSALYVAVSAQMRYTSAGRDVIQGSTLARSVFERMTSDILPNLGPIDPSRSSSSSSPSSSGQSSPTTGSAGASSAGASASGSGAGGSTGSTSAPASSGVNSAVTFNVGVQGDSTHLSVYVSRWPREIYQGMTGASDPSAQATVSDLRRITYWLSGGGDSSGGLARQEIAQATSDDALNSSTSPPDDSKLVIASEVRNVSFQYFDGQSQSWTDSWDGTSTGSDGTTPVGPPAAIAISLDIAMPHTGANEGSGGADIKTFRHVVVLQTANGPPATSGGGTSP